MIILLRAKKLLLRCHCTTWGLCTFVSPEGFPSHQCNRTAKEIDATDTWDEDIFELVSGSKSFKLEKLAP